VFPDYLTGFLFEGVDVTCTAIGADENQIADDQWVAMKASLVTVLLDVVRPTFLSALSVESIEGAGAGTDENQIPGDRRGGPDSTTRLKLP